MGSLFKARLIPSMLAAVTLAGTTLASGPVAAAPPFAQPPPGDEAPGDFAEPPPEPVAPEPEPPRLVLEPPPVTVVEPVLVREPVVLREPLGVRLGRAGLLLPASSEARDVGRFTLSARGGALARTDAGNRLAATALLELGLEVLPRLSVGVAYLPSRGALATLDGASSPLVGHTVLGQLRYAMGRWGAPDGRWMTQIQMVVGGGLYLLQEPALVAGASAAQGVAGAAPAGVMPAVSGLGSVGNTQQLGPGLRAGLDFSVYYRRVGLVLGYGFHYAPLREAAPGGLRDAGGHEVSGGLALRL